MRFRTCRRCGCPWNRSGNLICSDCGCMLTFARRPRPAPRLAPVPSAVPVPAATMPVPFGPRAGQPVSATRLAAATPAPSTVVAQVVLGLIVVLAALLVVLAAHGL